MKLNITLTIDEPDAAIYGTDRLGNPRRRYEVRVERDDGFVDQLTGLMPDSDPLDELRKIIVKLADYDRRPEMFPA